LAARVVDLQDNPASTIILYSTRIAGDRREPLLLALVVLVLAIRQHARRRTASNFPRPRLLTRL
jgi:hypothetical protein